MSTTTQFRTSKVPFLKEWNEAQFMCMKKAIAEHFNQRVFLNYRDGSGNHTTRIYKSFSQIDNILGCSIHKYGYLGMLRYL